MPGAAICADRLAHGLHAVQIGPVIVGVPPRVEVVVKTGEMRIQRPARFRLDSVDPSVVVGIFALETFPRSGTLQSYLPGRVLRSTSPSLTSAECQSDCGDPASGINRQAGIDVGQAGLQIGGIAGHMTNPPPLNVSTIFGVSCRCVFGSDYRPHSLSASEFEVRKAPRIASCRL
jgi:hypothetical protein